MAPEIAAIPATLDTLAPVAVASLLMASAGVMAAVTMTYARKRRPVSCAFSALTTVGAVACGLFLLMGA